MLAVGFDLDMTLIDSRPGIRTGLEAMSAETGVFVDVDVVVNRLGPMLETELAHWYPADGVDAAAASYWRHYWDHCVSGTSLLPGAAAAIASVRAREGRIVIVTAKSARHAQRCLDAVGIATDQLVGDVHGEGKRDGLRQHGVRVYVGDTTTDMQSARAAGATAVGVTTGPDDAIALRQAGADAVLTSLEGFPDWLDRWLRARR
jgi:phosphoglycolate phosphatase